MKKRKKLKQIINSAYHITEMLPDVYPCDMTPWYSEAETWWQIWVSIYDDGVYADSWEKT